MSYSIGTVLFMTLVLSAACRHLVFHASDRLTTVTPTRKNPDGAWDLHANKTVIALGSDCWLVIGYTGLAYLDGKPTDEFIACAIAGSELGGGVGSWHPGRRLHYREITRSIETAMADAYSRLPHAARRYPTIVSGVGVQNRKPRLRHVSFQSTISASGATHIEIANRVVRPLGIDHFQPIGSVNLPAFHKMRARLVNEGMESPDKFREVMMDAVVETGINSDVVGEDVMGVILDPLAKRIRVDYRAASPSRQIELINEMYPDDADRADIPTVSTPWILVPGMYFSPAVGTGGWHLANGGIDIELTGFDHDPEPGLVRAFWGAQPRRTQPL